MPKHRFSAADTALPAMTRRAALAAPLALLPSNTFASADSPILRLFHAHERLRRQLNALPVSASEAESDSIFNPMQRIEAEMMALPSTTAADFAAKTICDTSRGGVFSDWKTGKLWIEARALTGGGL